MDFWGASVLLISLRTQLVSRGAAAGEMEALHQGPTAPDWCWRVGVHSGGLGRNGVGGLLTPHWLCYITQGPCLPTEPSRPYARGGAVMGPLAM